MRFQLFVFATSFFALRFSGVSRSQVDIGQPISGSPITFDAVETPQADALQTSPLREQYLELAKTKAGLMTEETLKREIAATQRNIDELMALQKLQDAQEILLSITKEFPESEAATKATRMLEAIQALGRRASLRDDIGPVLNTASQAPVHRSSQSRNLPQTRSTDWQPQPKPQPQPLPNSDLPRAVPSDNGQPADRPSAVHK